MPRRRKFRGQTEMAYVDLADLNGEPRGGWMRVPVRRLCSECKADLRNYDHKLDCSRRAK